MADTALSPFPIVGIGASADGVEALQSLFRHIPPDAGLAYVVVTHLSADRISALPQILARFTTMPVCSIERDMAVEPNAVYVLAAGTILTIENRQLAVRRLDAGQREPKPVDIFLTSLATDVGEYAAGVMLSGGDGDGTLGMKAIKRHAGITLAQVADGAVPQNPQTPESAISSGSVDFPISVEYMGQKLLDFAHSLGLGVDARSDATPNPTRPNAYGVAAARLPNHLRGATVSRLDLRRTAEARVIERYGPPHVVVNRDGDIIHYSARTGRYLEPSIGAPNRQLFATAGKGLRPHLRSALRAAVESGRAVVRENLGVETEGEDTIFVTLTIEPVGGQKGDNQFFLVIFSEILPPELRPAVEAREEPNRAVEQPEQELHELRDRLQRLVEEYETALEGLKSANAELVSVNEELQSTNEEHEASKEELQSVNSDLAIKIDALDRANDDLQNLFESTRAAIIFLDQKLVIRSYTPAVSAIFNVKPSDQGRPLTDLASRIPLPTLKEDVETVFATGELIERQILQECEKQHFLIRMAPYRGRERRVEGVVVTFVDVTSLSKAEAQERLLHMELNHRVKNMLAVVIGIARHMEKVSGSPRIDGAAFVNRLLAMARAFELLSRENWTDASIDELIRQEFDAVSSDRVTIEGPQVRLLPKQALSIGMVVHELMTNAVKFGGLSHAGGSVSISWFESPPPATDQLTLIWRETTAAPVTQPEKYGFGLKIVEREGAYNLVGDTKIDFTDKGLEVALTFPTTGEVFRG